MTGQPIMPIAINQDRIKTAILAGVITNVTTPTPYELHISWRPKGQQTQYAVSQWLNDKVVDELIARCFVKGVSYDKNLGVYNAWCVLPIETAQTSQPVSDEVADGPATSTEVVKPKVRASRIRKRKPTVPVDETPQEEQTEVDGPSETEATPGDAPAEPVQEESV